VSSAQAVTLASQSSGAVRCAFSAGFTLATENEELLGVLSEQNQVRFGQPLRSNRITLRLIIDKRINDEGARPCES
jgi:hypothetical protein